jgi:hypothetical protein
MKAEYSEIDYEISCTCYAKNFIAACRLLCALTQVFIVVETSGRVTIFVIL